MLLIAFLIPFTFWTENKQQYEQQLKGRNVKLTIIM